jgi:hypothetical protein
MLGLLLSLMISQEIHTGKSGTSITAIPKITSAPTLYVNGVVTPIKEVSTSTAFSFYTIPKVNQTDTLSFNNSTQITNLTDKSISPTPAMSLGMNLSALYRADGYPYNFFKNRRYKLRDWNWNGVQVSQYNTSGIPTKITRSSIDTPLELAGVQGLWTVIYDTTDPATYVGINPWNDCIVVPRPDLSSPGNGGKAITRVFEIKSPPSISLNIQHPALTPAISNLWVIGPGNDLDTSDPVAIDQNILSKLTIGKNRGPTTVRMMDSTAFYGGVSNIVTPYDLPGFDPSITHTINTNIVSVRPVSVPVTLSTTYGNIQITDKKIWNIGWRWLGEAICSAPHNFSTGYNALINLGSARLLGQGNPLGTNFVSHVWVTSPTTFIFTGYGGTVPQDGPVDLDARTDTPGATASVDLPPGSVLPPESPSILASQWPNTAAWVSIPAAANDACVAEIARRNLARLGPTNTVIVEYSNETWNWGFPQSNYCLVMAGVTNLPRGWTDYYTVKRASECVAIFASIFSRAGRAKDVKLCLASQFGWMTRPLLTYAASVGVKADVVAGAPYMALGYPNNWDVSSLTTAQLHDLMRSYITYDPYSITTATDFNTAVSAYERAIGKPVQRISYEGGIEAIAGDPYAWASHPDAYDTEMTFYDYCQKAGFNTINYFSLLDVPRANGNFWGLYSQLLQSSTPRGQAWLDWQRNYHLNK